MFILISMSESINTHTAKTFWQCYFGLVPPCKQHPAQKSCFGGEKVIWSWCFWPYGAGAGLKGMQDTHGPGKEIAQSQCRRCCIIMSILFIYVYIYIEEIQGTESPKSRKIQKVLIENNACSLLCPDIKKHAFLRSSQRVPLRWVAPPK